MELLITLAIMSIIASITLQIFGPARQGATDTKDKRNAQEIANVAAFASASGAAFVVPNDEAATIQNLVQGRTPPSGVFRNRVFKLPPMIDSDIQGAMRYLSLNQSQLSYNQETQ